MDIKDLLSKEVKDASPLYMTMAQYAANQCTGCSDSPMILAYKAQQAMLEAHKNGENPIQRLNDFLGTSIPEDVLLSLISDNQ